MLLIYNLLIFSKAYQIACLNVTDTDWKILAREALEHFDLLIAKKAFANINELKYLELITQYEVNKFVTHFFFLYSRSFSKHACLLFFQ